MKRLVSIPDLIEEAKVRMLWWAICIFAISYFLSHTSKSMWMNVPIAVLIALAMRVMANEVEFHWKVPQYPKKSYLSYLEKKQLSLNDSRLSTAPPAARWKRKIDSPVVEAALQAFIDKVLRDFVIDLWYSDITPDKEAPDLMRGVIMDALGEVTGRVKEVNLVELLTRDMIDLIGDHIELYRRTQATIGVDVMKTLSTEERDERLKHHLITSKELHPALISPESEYKYLQRIIGGLLAVVLRPREAQVPLVRCIARELLTCLVIQPILNLVSPMYINELIEYIAINFEAFANAMEDNSQSSKANQDIANLARQEMSASKGHDMSVDKIDPLNTKALGNSENIYTGLTHGETMHRTADWARILDAATQRRTEVLAPENLENLWARGRNYKDKLNTVGRGPQSPPLKGLADGDTALLTDHEKAMLASRHGSVGEDIKDLNQVQHEPIINAETAGSNTSQMTQSEDVDEKSTIKRGLIFEGIGDSDVVSDERRRKFKRSNSASALKFKPTEQRANTGGNRELIILEDYNNPNFARKSGEHEMKSPPDTMLHAEGSQFPKLRCRVIGAFFEKIGSKSFAVYSIAVTDAENNTWFVKRRYRNFERLHRHLKDIPNYNLHLPPKRIFSSSTEDKFVHQRCIQLDKYLQDLLSIANVAEQHEVWDFVSASSKNYSFGRSPSVMRTLAVNVDDAVDDIVRQFKGVSDEFMRKVVGSSSTHHEASSYVPIRNLSWNADDIGRHNSTHISVETSNSHSDNEEGDGDEGHAFDEASCSPQAKGWHSDNELNSKDFPPRVVKRIEDSRIADLEEKPGSDLTSELIDTSRATSLPVSFAHMEDPMGVPPEWTPPNVTVPVLNLVDKIFQLNRRGWIRRQVFWISKQILQLVMEDAVDDFLLSQIHWLRNEDVIAQGIRWIQDNLWPDDKFFLKLEITPGKSAEDKCPGTPSHSSGWKVPPPCSFEVQLEAIRRANFVRKLLFDGAPTALVSLVGNKQYRRCARDIYFFLQSSICVKQLAYGGLELILTSLFPELRDVIVDAHKKMRAEQAAG